MQESSIITRLFSRAHLIEIDPDERAAEAEDEGRSMGVSSGMN